MFSSNNRISKRQIKRMLIFDMFSISSLLVPTIAARGAGKDGLLAIIVGTLLAYVYGFIILYFAKKSEGDYMEYSRQVLGKVLYSLFGILYLIKLLFSCIFAASLFAKVINETLLVDTSYLIILAVLLLVAALAASKGNEVRARIAEILFFIVLVPIIFLLLCGLIKIDINNLLPLYTTGSAPIFKTGYLILLTYSAVELVLFATPLISNEQEKKSSGYVFQAISVTGVINLILFAVVAGFLGVGGTSKKLWSSVTIMQIIKMPGGFVQRQDAVMLAFWLLSIFTVLCTFLYYLNRITATITGVGKHRFFFLPFLIIIFLISAGLTDIEAAFRLYGRYLAYVGLPQSILMPLAVVFIGMVKKAFERKPI